MIRFNSKDFRIREGRTVRKFLRLQLIRALPKPGFFLRFFFFFVNSMEREVVSNSIGLIRAWHSISSQKKNRLFSGTKLASSRERERAKNIFHVFDWLVIKSFLSWGKKKKKKRSQTSLLSLVKISGGFSWLGTIKIFLTTEVDVIRRQKRKQEAEG